MKFKEGEKVKIMTLDEACKKNNTSPSMYNKDFFDIFANKLITIVMMNKDDDLIQFICDESYFRWFKKGELIGIGADIIKKLEFKLPDELFTM